MSVELTKRTEAYVMFAKFCKYHDAPAQTIGEIIQLISDSNKLKGHAPKQAKREFAASLLQSVGFQNVTFGGDDWPTFTDRYDDKIRLPEIV